jgi:GT2 family glycosyltransferase
MDVSIIIVNYNTRDFTLQCLKSVYEKTIGISFEVIVVDNASSDDSVIQIKQYFPQVNLIESTENLGFGRANNLGFDHSSGDYIFLLNSDTLLINNAIEILWHFLEEHDSFAIAGGQLYEGDGLTETHSYSHLFPSISMELDELLGGLISRFIDQKRLKFLKKDEFDRVAYITGADMMLRRSDIEELGFFDPIFFLYFEETELSYRFHKHGKISVFFPAAKIIHLAGASFSLGKARSNYYLDGRKKYYKITHSWIYHMICNIIWELKFFKLVLKQASKQSKRKEWLKRVQIVLRQTSNN